MIMSKRAEFMAKQKYYDLKIKENLAIIKQGQLRVESDHVIQGPGRMQVMQAQEDLSDNMLAKEDLDEIAQCD
jgi:hypothetical protein